MKRSSALLAAACLIAFASAQSKYTTKFDNIDIDAVVKNQKLLTNYIGCLLDKNACTAEAIELKRNLPEGLETNCLSCSERQKYVTDKLSHYIIDNRPSDWKELEDKYDPTGAYRKRYRTGAAGDSENSSIADTDKKQ